MRTPTSRRSRRWGEPACRHRSAGASVDAPWHDGATRGARPAPRERAYPGYREDAIRVGGRARASLSLVGCRAVPVGRGRACRSAASWSREDRPLPLHGEVRGADRARRGTVIRVTNLDIAGSRRGVCQDLRSRRSCAHALVRHPHGSGTRPTSHSAQPRPHEPGDHTGVRQVERRPDEGRRRRLGVTLLSDIAIGNGPKAQHPVPSRGPSGRAREPRRASGHRSSCVDRNGLDGNQTALAHNEHTDVRARPSLVQGGLLRPPSRTALRWSQWSDSN